MQAPTTKAKHGGNGGGGASANGVTGIAPNGDGRRLLLRIAVIGTLLLLAAFGAYWKWGRGSLVGVVKPTRGSAAEVVYATGIVEPVFWAKVTSLLRKRIVDICKCEGKSVNKGDVLVRLDDFEERAVLRELEARLRRYEDDLARLKLLVDRNVTSKTSYDEKQTQVHEQEARVAAQRDRIADLQLRSPMDGVVLKRDGEVGEIAGTGASDVLMWVGQPRPLRVVAEVNEDDIIKVRIGQKVLLRHEGHTGAPLTGNVDSITPKGDPQSKTFRVYLALPDDTPLRIGMSVEANIVVREVQDALLVPAEAINSGHVAIVKNSRVERRAVETGIRGSRMVQVLAGLSEGEVVVSPNSSDLTTGTKVRAATPAAK